MLKAVGRFLRERAASRNSHEGSSKRGSQQVSFKPESPQLQRPRSNSLEKTDSPIVKFNHKGLIIESEKENIFLQEIINSLPDEINYEPAHGITPGYIFSTENNNIEKLISHLEEKCGSFNNDGKVKFIEELIKNIKSEIKDEPTPSLKLAKN